MWRYVLCGVLFTASLGWAQEKKAKKTPFDNVAGYKVHTLAGFTVVVNQEVLNADVSKYKKPPLECIEAELKNVCGLVNEKAANALRKVPIWAEWNDGVRMSNGRAGQAYAVYYGGNQISMLGRGMQPLKAKCVTLLLTEELTRSYQGKDRPEELVMLHELAHAVHDQLLGFENPDVKAAYQQAMSRKLYDKSLYIATNESEFFAEATCAFLDRLSYYPKNRADLKTHDPVTYKTLDKIWGKSSTAGADALKVKRPPNGSGEFNLAITVDRIRWSPALVGERYTSSQAKGQVVLIAYAVPDQAAILNRLKTWNDEYDAYGLDVLISNAAYRYEPQSVGRAFARLDLPFPVLDSLYLAEKESGVAAEKAGHAVLFNHTGECIFRGPADDATIYLKEAIGARLAEQAEMNDPPMLLRPAVDALRAGEPLASVASKAQNLASSSDTALSDAAKKLIAVITDPGTKLLAEAQSLKKTEPLIAFLKAESVAIKFKGLSVAAKANSLMESLRSDKTVLQELAARRDYATVMKIETQLSGQAGSFEPRSPRFQAQNAGLLNQLKTAVEVMKKKHATAKCTEKALAIAKDYGIE